MVCSYSGHWKKKSVFRPDDRVRLSKINKLRSISYNQTVHSSRENLLSVFIFDIYDTSNRAGEYVCLLGRDGDLYQGVNTI